MLHAAALGFEVFFFPFFASSQVIASLLRSIYAIS